MFNASYQRLLLVCILQLVAIVCLGVNTPSHASSGETPYSMLDTIANRTFESIKALKSERNSHPSAIEKIINKELMPHVDYRFAAFKVLGNYAKKASKEELVAFIAAFRENLVQSYSVTLGNLDDHRIEFIEKPYTSTDKFLSIKASVISDIQAPIKIIFKLRKSRQRDEWKVYDIEAEGISMIASKQSEFAPILRKHGVSKLIEILDTKPRSDLSVE